MVGECNTNRVGGKEALPIDNGGFIPSVWKMGHELYLWHNERLPRKVRVELGFEV